MQIEDTEVASATAKRICFMIIDLMMIKYLMFLKNYINGLQQKKVSIQSSSLKNRFINTLFSVMFGKFILKALYFKTPCV